MRLLSHFMFSVVDGDDMTRYDDMKISGGITPRIVGDGDMEDDDEEIAMNDLELELASQTGRLTGQYG